MSYLAVFRTHVWDETIAILAARFKEACPSGDFIILYDETNGRSPELPGYSILRHTADLTDLGLPEVPKGRSLWYNADYALYVAQNSYPGYDYYILSEYDVAVNVGMDGIIQSLRERGIDLVAHEVVPAQADWGGGHWYQNAVRTFERPWRSFIAFIIISRRALLFLMQARRDQAAALFPAQERDWPYCESFIPTTLIEQASMTVAQLHEWLMTDHYDWRPFYNVEDERVFAPGSIAHPVIGGARYLRAMIDLHPAQDYFVEGTFLHGLGLLHPFEAIQDKLREKLIHERDLPGLELWRAACHQRQLSCSVTFDLAYCRPALTSSVSPWSFSQDAALDAAGANGPEVPEVAGFHTAEEIEPWWQVDLLDDHLIDAVTITNRPDVYFRFRQFSIRSSQDGSIWLTRYSKSDDTDVSADEDAPWRLDLDDPFVARYVRIQLAGTGVMHLRRIQVFGRAVVPAPARETYALMSDQPAANKNEELQMSDSNPGLMAVLNALDTPEVKSKLEAHTFATVLGTLFGRRFDSFNVDQLEWLVAAITSSDYASERMRKATRHGSNLELLSFALSQVSMQGMFLEFGVFSGNTINHIATVCPHARVYGFDSFEGLPETWRPGFAKGAFAVAGLPAVRENVELVRGWFDRTLPSFCDAHPGEPVAFLHVDCDLYSSTQTIFTQLNNRIVPGTIIVFDEYFNYPGWKQHEVRAFAEYCLSNGVSYHYIGLVPHHQQVAVRIIGRE